MDLARAGGWTGARVAAHVLSFPAERPQARLHERPAAHVERFFLRPDKFLGLAIAGQRFPQPFDREGIELLDADQRDLVGVGALAPFEQIVIDLAAAEYNAAHARRIGGRIIQDLLEMPLGKFFHRREGALVPQQALGRHQDQRLAAEDVEVLRRRRQVADLDIVLRTLLEKAFQPRARVLWPLPFVAVRQQQDQAAVTLPLGLAADQELIDDHLRPVDEVAELCFPEDQRAGRIPGIAEIKAEHRRFGQQAVVDAERCLLGPEGVQRVEGLAGAGIEEHRMALAERAAARILAAEANVRPLQEQRPERQGFGKRPVNRPALFHLLAPHLQLPGNLGMDLEVLGDTGQRAGDVV